ncbi:tRNA pseudouridine(38-40) synthase TruA [bacterium]|nr:tRNA pseudouridine(38-40) synthase TruA [bacterium]MCK4325277.1 tRNA pseudouridine(38-40) synthase TruA [bacterium]MCK4436687.1 tRNA pseudouridine(38-40) synthase TruA [bacterium]
MRNIKLTIEYDGGSYHGWQRQPHSATVQETIEKALTKVLQEKVNLVGASRTDAGVHARGQAANLKTKSRIPLRNLKAALNSLLPEDIVIKSCLLAEDDFHARYGAKGKFYRYTILNRALPSPFLRKYAYFFPHPLGTHAMKKAAKYLIGRHDFSSFRGQATGRENCIRIVKKLTVKSVDNSVTSKKIPVGSGSNCISLDSKHKLIHIDIEADGFLYNMARVISGTLLEVGRGKIGPQDIREILRARDRRHGGPTLPPHGLCLVKVKY